MAKHHIIHFVARPSFAPKKKKTKIADEPEGVSDLAKLLHIKPCPFPAYYPFVKPILYLSFRSKASHAP